jgi:hypothetical protein
MILKNPIMDDRMPPAITTCHRESPKFSTLVATLLRLPRILKPKTIMDKPRNIRLASALSRGQFRSKYDLNSPSSDTTRNKPIVLVMKCDTPSKKKNYKECQTHKSMRM